MKEKVKTILIILLVIIIILLLLLIFRGLANGVIKEENSKILEFASKIDFPLEYKVLKVKEEKNIKKEEIEVDKRTITYSGSGRYEISEENPYIVLSNPENNFVDMEFEIKDLDRDVLLLKTDKIIAGEYLYVNVYNFYKTVGVYHISIDIASYDHENGEEKNGMHEEAEIIVS